MSLKENRPLVPSLTANCFQCKREIQIKYVVLRKRYSLKNDWYYWTEDEKNKDKKICDNCLRNFYNDDKVVFWNTVKNKKRREVLRFYFNSNLIKADV